VDLLSEETKGESTERREIDGEEKTKQCVVGKIGQIKNK
jgi:hypothetical protein